MLPRRVLLELSITGALVVLLHGCSGPFVRKDLQEQYQPKIKRVAVLPFKNLTSGEQAQQAHVGMREGVFAELKRRDVDYTMAIQSLGETDQLLSEAGVTADNMGAKPPHDLGAILGVDAVLDGSLIKYEEKGKTGQFITAALLGEATGSEVICRVSIMDCETEALLWDWEITEKGGLLASPESVANKVGEKVAKKWPFKKEN